jgi:hypothetical protein
MEEICANLRVRAKANIGMEAPVVQKKSAVRKPCSQNCWNETEEERS